MEVHTTLELFSNSWLSNGWKGEPNYPNWTPIILDTPPEGEEVLVSNGKWVWLDTLCNNGDFLYWDNSDCELEETAWMPLPPLWKKE